MSQTQTKADEMGVRGLQEGTGAAGLEATIASYLPLLNSFCTGLEHVWSLADNQPHAFSFVFRGLGVAGSGF